MKISFSNIKEREVIPFNSTLDSFFSDKNKICKRILGSDGEISLEKAGDTLIARFDIDFKVVVLSSYTNKPFDTIIKLRDELYFTDTKVMEDDEMIYVDDEIDLDEVVYSLLITSIPMNLHKKGEELPSGEGYEVMSEDEFLGKSHTDSPFDKLKNLNLDD